MISALGAHELFGRPPRELANLLLAVGKSTFAARISPPQLRATSFPHPPREAPMLCWLAIGEHESFGRHLREVGNLILAGGKLAFAARISPVQPASSTPLGKPKCFAG